MQKVIILLSLVPALVACATVERAPPDPSVFEAVEERNYTLGAQHVVPVGDAIVRVKEYVVEHRPAQSVRSNSDFSIRGCIHDIRFTEGQELPVSGRRSIDGRVAVLVPITGYQLGIPNNNLRVQAFSDGTIHYRVFSGLFELPYRCEPDRPDARLTPVSADQIEGDLPYQNYEMVFSGSDGNAIRFTYREYSRDDLTRTSYSQELSYPITTRTIQMRNIVIEIVALDDRSITYIVQSDK